MTTRQAPGAFPRYPTHTEASCFSCGSDLDGYFTASGFAPGRGAFLQDCEKCRTTTWYDLEKTNV